MIQKGKLNPNTNMTLGEAIKKRKNIIKKMKLNIIKIRHTGMVVDKDNVELINTRKEEIRKLEQSNEDLAIQHITLNNAIEETNKTITTTIEFFGKSITMTINDLLYFKNQSEMCAMHKNPVKIDGCVNLLLQTYRSFHIPQAYEPCVDVHKRTLKLEQLIQGRLQIESALETINNETKLKF